MLRRPGLPSFRQTRDTYLVLQWLLSKCLQLICRRHKKGHRSVKRTHTHEQDAPKSREESDHIGFGDTLDGREKGRHLTEEVIFGFAAQKIRRLLFVCFEGFKVACCFFGAPRQHQSVLKVDTHLENESERKLYGSLCVSVSNIPKISLGWVPRAPQSRRAPRVFSCETTRARKAQERAVGRAKQRLYHFADLTDALKDVLWMQQVVANAQEEHPGRRAHEEVCWQRVVVFKGNIGDMAQQFVAALFRADENRKRGRKMHSACVVSRRGRRGSGGGCCGSGGGKFARCREMSERLPKAGHGKKGLTGDD